MNQEFHLCFIFQKLHLEVSQDHPLQSAFSYKIELFQDLNFISKTGLTPRPGSQPQEIELEDCFLTLKLDEKELFNKPTGEIRLIQTDYNSHQHLIGCYSFSLTNHIHPYQQFNRNSIQLSIQIAVNYTLNYEVIVQNSQLALEQLKKEHFYSRKLDFVEKADSEKADFLPQELTTRHRRESFKKIKLLNESQSVIVNSRFWSPEKERIRRSASSEITKTSIDTIQLQLSHKVEEKTPSSSIKLKFKRAGSQCSQESERDKIPLLNQSTLDEFQTSSLSGDNSLEEEHLYEVIKSNSKITIPAIGNKYERYIQIKEEFKEQPKYNEGYLEQCTSNSFLLKVVLLIAIMLISGLGISILSKSIKSKLHKAPSHKIRS